MVVSFRLFPRKQGAGALLMSGLLALTLSACNQTNDPTPQTPIVDDSAPVVTSPPVAPPVPNILPPGRIEDIDFEAYSQDLAQGIGLKMGMALPEARDTIRIYFISDDSSQVASSTFDAAGGRVMVFRRSGLADDSLQAEELLTVFRKIDDGVQGETLVFFGLRLKCWRGNNPDQWQTENCL